MVTIVAPSATDDLDRGASARRALRALIKVRWSKFTDFELGALAGNDDLANQVALKYGLELTRAKLEVAELLKGQKI